MSTGGYSADQMSLSGTRRREIRQIINDDEAAVIRRLARDTLDGVPLQTQARRLMAQGVPTPSGRGAWTGAHIARLLKNPGLAGHRVYDGQVVARDAWPEILDGETHDRLTALLSQPERRLQRGSALAHQGSGAYLCGECRSPLRTHKRTRYVCLRCMKTSAAIHLMDPTVDAFILARLREPDAVAAFAPMPDDRPLAEARERLGVLRARLDELHMAAALPHGPTVAMLAAAERSLLPQIALQEQEIRRLATPQVLQDLDPLDLAETWPDRPVALRREVILSLAEIVLSACGKGGRFSEDRLRESRWRGARQTWGEAYA